MTRSASVLAAAFAVLAVLVGPVAVGDAAEVAAAGCGPAPTGQVAVATVVDDGSDVSVRCTIVAERTDGYGVLRAAGHQLRIEAGFLCAIDGVPATGCGNRPGFDGSYWRYFHASPGGGWEYSSVGGGGYRMPSRCAIEGWRWSSAGGADTPPRAAPPAMTCEAPPPTVAPTVPPAATAPPATAAPGGAGAEGEVAPADPGSTATVPAPGRPGTPPTDVGTSAGDTPSDSPDGTPTSTTVDGAVGGADEGTDADASTEFDDPGEERAAASNPGDSDGGSPVGLLLTAVVVAALGAGAVWRNRRATSGETEESVEDP